jgi:hypothetical protein
MSYRAGMGHMLAARLGCVEGPPRIICDGCGEVRRVENKYGMPSQWFLANRHAPGWALERTESDAGVKRVDLCPKCRPAKARR